MQAESPLQFPKRIDKDRLDRYAHYDRLYEGDHYAAFAIKGEKEFTDRYNRLRYIAVPFAGLLSRTMADMLFGETITLDYKEKANQAFSQGLWADNQLRAQLYESALSNSRKGDDLFKVRVGQRNPLIPGSKSTVIIEQVTPAVYFPELDQMATRNIPTKDIIAMTFTQGPNTYLHKEIHVPGYIFHEVYRYDPNQQRIVSQEKPEAFGYPESEKTLIERSLIFHVPNVRDGSGYWGTSDYKDLETLFFAINNRLTKTDNILDKHSDPILAVPPGVIDEEGKVKKEALGMFEVDNENPGFNKPEYIVWNANLEAAFTETDKILELLFLFGEVSPAGTPLDKGGVAESGRALKFKLLSTIRKRNRKIIYYDQVIKDIMEVSQLLAISHGIEIDGNRISKLERPNIKWGDGVINDHIEQVEMTTQRIDNGTMSRSDAIAQLDDIPIEDAKVKAKEIEEENAPKMPVVTNNTSGNTPPNPPQPAADPKAQQPAPAGR